MILNDYKIITYTRELPSVSGVYNINITRWYQHYRLLQIFADIDNINRG